MSLLKTFFLVCVIFSMAGCTGVMKPEPESPGTQTQPPVVTSPPATATPPKTPPAPGQAKPQGPIAPPDWATNRDRARSGQQSSAVVALMNKADKNSRSGNMEGAAAALEQGLRIDPRNATLMFRLAEVRSKQAKFQLAEDLARKAALLAGNDRSLKRKCWFLIANSRRNLGNVAGAQEAEKTAQRF